MVNEVQKDLGPVWELIEDFGDNAQKELDGRMSAWPVVLSARAEFEVIGGLLARQVTLARQLAESPGVWTGHVAPIILRAMADVFINVAWILKDPLDRSRKYVLFGLGQMKLELEHRKNKNQPSERSPDEVILIEATEAWIERQRHTFLTEVNLGSWSGKNVREMAVEADCLDFYDFAYQPFSACTHSMWQHVSRYNLRACSNPLHQYHGVPSESASGIDPHYLFLASKYLTKTFNEFDEHYHIQFDGNSSHGELCRSLAALSKEKIGSTESDGPSE